MKRIAISMAAALAALTLYFGILLFTLWGGSPGDWYPSDRAIAAGVGMVIVMIVFIATYTNLGRRHG